jgi:hypothetical protein
MGQQSAPQSRSTIYIDTYCLGGMSAFFVLIGVFGGSEKIGRPVFILSPVVGRDPGMHVSRRLSRACPMRTPCLSPAKWPCFVVYLDARRRSRRSAPTARPRKAQPLVRLSTIHLNKDCKAL